jgi:hypothetical protein
VPGVRTRSAQGACFDFGACSEFPLTDPADDIVDRRFTGDLAVRW